MSSPGEVRSCEQRAPHRNDNQQDQASNTPSPGPCPAAAQRAQRANAPQWALALRARWAAPQSTHRVLHLYASVDLGLLLAPCRCWDSPHEGTSEPLQDSALGAAGGTWMLFIH